MPMIAPEANHQDASGTAPLPEEPLTRLRGNSVEVDIRRTGRIVGWICCVALLVTGVVLLVAGVHTNDQINRLHDQGVPVRVTVTSCTGLIGGTGGQVAGYSCTGTYRVGGTLYRQAIPGTTAFHQVGTTIDGVVVPGDPKLLSTPDQVAAQHASWRVIIVPAILILAALAIGAALLRGRRIRTPPPGQPSAPDGPR
jgi:hypothetical protein